MNSRGWRQCGVRLSGLRPPWAIETGAASRLGHCPRTREASHQPAKKGFEPVFALRVDTFGVASVGGVVRGRAIAFRLLDSASGIASHIEDHACGMSVQSPLVTELNQECILCPSDTDPPAGCEYFRRQ